MTLGESSMGQGDYIPQIHITYMYQIPDVQTMAECYMYKLLTLNPGIPS